MIKIKIKKINLKIFSFCFKNSRFNDPPCKNKKCWYEGELHEKLSKKRKRAAFEFREESLNKTTMTSFLQSYENIKRAYKILTSTDNKLKKVDEYSDCSDTLIVQENPEWRPIGKAEQNFIAKFLYPHQPPRTIQKIRETEKKLEIDIQCVHIKTICK